VVEERKEESRGKREEGGTKRNSTQLIFLLSFALLLAKVGRCLLSEIHGHFAFPVVRIFQKQPEL
jgi:hypothetical protein